MRARCPDCRRIVQATFTRDGKAIRLFRHAAPFGYAFTGSGNCEGGGTVVSIHLLCGYDSFNNIVEKGKLEAVLKEKKKRPCNSIK